MKARYILLLSIVILSFTACENAYMNPTPETDNLSIFNEYAKIVTEKYALSDVKNVDLEALADSIRPFISDNISEEELYDYMYIITQRMQEGHTVLTARNINKTPFTSYEWYNNYPIAYSTGLASLYYSPDSNPDAVEYMPEGTYFSLHYGFLPNHKDIGFIRLTTFSIDLNNNELEMIMEHLKDTKGLVIDVRSNIGGFVELAARLTSYFTTTEYVFATNKIKNGPGPDDFASSEMKITPSGSPLTYTKPVMLLHDRVSFSSGSIFPVMMSPLDHVTTLGVTFGGGTGEIVEGLLSNGWEYIISTSNLVDSQGRPTDPGIAPDIEVLINEQDTLVDEVIERAILEIENR